MISAIAPKIQFNPIFSTPKRTNVSFRGLSPVDSFEKSNELNYKKVTLKDLDGYNVGAFIISKDLNEKNYFNAKQKNYTLYVRGEKYGEMHIYVDDKLIEKVRLVYAQDVENTPTKRNIFNIWEILKDWPESN